MQVDGVDLPEPFGASLLRSEAAEVADRDVVTPQEQFARGLVRAAIGRDADARSDFEATLPALGDACRVELALLDARKQSGFSAALKAAQRVAATATNPTLAGRAWHIVGLAQGKLRRTSAAVDALRQAEEHYRSAGSIWGRAQVRDTLGMIEAARGRLDYAVQCYALSLVDKSLLGDRLGMAITLGNLGRLHLRAGRFHDALECLMRDLEIAEALHDLRGQARVRQDLGRVRLADGDLETAAIELRRSLELGEQHQFEDVVFYAYKDLALVELARKQLDVADGYFRQARQHMPTNSGPYYQLIWDAAYAELLVARRDAQAAEWLQRVIAGFADAELPDFEICARLALAKTWTEGGYSALAERCLGAALKMARSDGYTRYLAPLNEAMLQLDLVEGVLTETGRPVATEMTTTQSYVVRSQLGAGAFGDVFRVYDSSRGDDFALKRLRLSQLYDTQRRRVVLNSAHCELEAGSRVRHPGVARVWAIGTEPTGDIYVLQDFVAGTALSSHLPSDTSAPLPGVLATLAQLAFALQALHDAGVVHRDLKPGNVLLPAPGRPVLVDFGIAHIPSSQHCDPDHLAGTLPYMAPEQALCKNVNAQADLYSLGVIAYQWLSGTFPLHLRGETFAEMVCDLTTRPPAPLSDFRPDVPDDVEKLVMSLLAKNPAAVRQPPRPLLKCLQTMERDWQRQPPRPAEF